MPVSDLPSDDEEEDEQVGGGFGNDFKCRFYRQRYDKVSLARCASLLLLGKTLVCPTVSFFCYFRVARTGTKGRDLRRVLTGML